MTVLEALEALFSCDKQRRTGEVHLVETDPSAGLRQLTLTHLTMDMMVLYVDEGRRVRDRQNRTVAICMSPLFTITDAFAHNRACDAVLVKEMAGKCHIYYIELKSDKPSGYAGQFKSAKCFFRYVRDILKDLYEVDMIIDKERYVIFHTDSQGGAQSLGKQTTRPRVEYKNSPESPDMYVVRDNSAIHCNRFMRNS